ncbi:hypothetical protein [Cupriavidus necator]
MKRSILAIGICLIAAQGCATKHYGRQGTVTDFERQTLSCREIALEQAKVNGFIQHVDRESQFDGRSVLAFLGDFGIGNVMEHSAATESATARMHDLQALSVRRGCGVETRAAAAPASALPKPVLPAPHPGPHSRSVEALANRDMCMPVGAALLVASSEAGDMYRVNCMGGMIREYACAGASCSPAR